MSTSIYGTIEVKKFDSGFDDWYGIIDVGISLTGNYDMFGCLFGIRNPSNFKPLFPSRGEPNDCSEELLREYKSSDINNGLTWCTYQELLDVNLDELSEIPDSRFVDDEGVKRYPNNESEKAQCKHLSRREALDDPEYHQLIELMGVLAKRYGHGGVRMVVYFD